ncbi:acyltransferase family protein [Asticcacaulis sp. SL142]|uniref:acyltransferase family protein n=1 Tax=Asticcacaulis sp. SL142 TaxID=2995155 RepID=UPI00226C7438|nr:acyltransferase family protein [Asticcacaulis sp. SL142]WAC49724.1 acyltransferase family protein [Asticcacaulis sp. SL142]
MKYRADIDGLRALAVLPVVLFHAGIPGISGGFIGVDVFFVISGYLITGILRDDLEAGRFSIAQFYERRIRRIIPALAAVIIATWITAWLLFLPSYFQDFSKSVAATAAFISNLYFWKYSGYFEASALLRPLLHTWSLAVEEQFYIVMPIAMWVAFKLIRKHWVWLFALGAAGSLALSIYLTDVGPTANFFLLPTRAWELLAGSLLALMRLPAPRTATVAHVLSGLGLLLILVPIVVYTEATPFPGLTALPPVLGAVLLIYSGAFPAGLGGRVLSWAPMVFIGKISYSLYLVHWPVTVFVRYVTLEPPSLMWAGFIILLSFILAVLSWRFIEQPFRQPGFAPSRPVLLVGTLAGLVALFALGSAGVTLKGFPDRFPDYDPVVVADGRTNSWNNNVCFFEAPIPYEKWNADQCRIVSNGPEAVLLWGDSYAAHYVPGLTDNAAHIPYTLYQYTAAGCPPVLSYYSYARPNCQNFNANALKLIKTLNIKTVILSARWIDMKSRGMDQIQSTLSALKAMGVKTYVIGQSPLFVTDVGVIAFRQVRQTPRPSVAANSFGSEINESLHRATGDVVFTDPLTSLCPNGTHCTYRQGERLLFSDSGHFSNSGSGDAVRLYFPLYTPLKGKVNTVP